MNKLRGVIDPTEISHNHDITSCHHMQYAHRYSLENIPSIDLSIVHKMMDKSMNSIPRMGKKEKDISNVMNLPISLIVILTHGHKTRGFGHCSLSFFEMGSNFTMTSLIKCLIDIEKPMVDQYGDFI
jgi:hypothetical protein